MGFGEAAQHKFVLEVAFDSSRRPTVEPIRVPCFRRLFSLRGDRASIESQVTGMVGHSETASPLPPWIEIQLNEPLEAFQLGTEIERLLAPLGGETLRYTAERFTSAAETTERRLEDLDERRALELRLEAARIPEEQRKPYRDRYGEILFQMRQESMEKQTVARLPGNHQ